MKTSSLEVTKLLDKLYNLRGSDSVVLKEMESARVLAEETKERTTKEKGALQEKISNLQSDSKELEDQGKRLIEVLSGIDKKDFETVISRLNINFDPEALTDRLNSKLPETIEGVNNDIARSEEELVKVEEEMNGAITKIEELGIRKDTAIANQEKLNEYFELALSGNINITRDSITALLEQFDFSEEETREAAKILMFPEDALFDYDNRLKGAEKKSIGDVIKEAKSQESAESPVVETKSEEPNASGTVESVEISLEESNAPAATSSEKTIDKEDLIDLFNEIGLDYLDYTTSDLEEILSHYNEKVIRRNVAIFKNNDLSLDVFVDHINLLYDKELEAKVDRLLRIGKSALDIYLNPTVLTKYDYRNLDKAIILLQNSGLDPKKVPLMAY